MRHYLVCLFILAVGFSSCKKGEKHDNIAPETQLVFESINLSGDDRLNSKVELSWFGTDKDGYIKGFEISLDNTNWGFVTSQDSTFVFELSVGSDTTDIDFYIRSVDNFDVVDPTPAYLKIPLKNTPPSVKFIETSLPEDSIHLVATFSWLATDNDGNETVTNAFLKVNNGTWYQIPTNASLISVISNTVETNGITDAKVHYNGKYSTDLIDDFNNNGINTFYLKVVDFAGAESKVDTSNEIFISSKSSSDLLFISGQDDLVTGTYKNLLSSQSYDFLNYQIAEKQPKFWEPTFSLIIEQYKYLFIHADANVFTNSYNQQSGLLLDFMAPSLQTFFNDRGKAFVTTSFSLGDDISAISEVFPIDSISTSNGHARIMSDSLIYPVDNLTFPSLSPTNIIIGVSPFNPTQDATPIYEAQLRGVSGWTGPKVVAAKRSVGGSTNQIFYSIQLYKFDKDPVAQKTLVESMLTELGL